MQASSKEKNRRGKEHLLHNRYGISAFVNIDYRHSLSHSHPRAKATLEQKIWKIKCEKIDIHNISNELFTFVSDTNTKLFIVIVLLTSAIDIFAICKNFICDKNSASKERGTNQSKYLVYWPINIHLHTYLQIRFCFFAIHLVID